MLYPAELRARDFMFFGRIKGSGTGAMYHFFALIVNCFGIGGLFGGLVLLVGLKIGKNIRKRGGNLLKNKSGSYIVPATALRKKNCGTRLFSHWN